MAKKKSKPTTSDTIDIKDDLEGPIEAVIERLQALQKEYPGGRVEITREYEYGESYERAYLHFERAKTAAEIEYDVIDQKTRLLEQLKSEATAFARNDASYPRQAEIDALRKELGFLAMAPRNGMLRIYEGEIIVWDMMHGGRRKNGDWVFRRLSFLGDEAHETKMAAWLAERDKEYIVE